MIRFLIAVLFLIPVYASAVAGMPESFNFSGRLTDSTNTAVENNVDLTFQIFDPSGACLLYEETGSVNTITTAGRFSVNVGSSVGAAKRQAGVDPGLSMNTIFRNGATITGAGGCSYIASPGDERQLKVTITKIGSTTMSEVFASHAIRSVPFAMLAESANDLQGKTPGNFVQVNTSGTEVLTQNNVETIFDNANYTKLTALLAGTSSLYNKPASNGTSVLPNIAIVSTPAAGQVWYDAGSIKYYDGATTQVLSTGGTQTNITATGTITGATIVGTNGTITNFGSRKIQLFDADSSNWVTLQTPSVVTADYTLTLPPDDGTLNQVLTTNGSGVLTWTTPAAGSVTGVTATAPIASSGGSAPDISIPKATALADGYLSATDFGTFSSKLGKALASGNIWVGGSGGNASEVT